MVSTYPCIIFSLPIKNYTILMPLFCALTIFSTVFSTLIQTSPTLTRSGILKIMQSNGPGSTGLTFTWIPVLFAYVVRHRPAAFVGLFLTLIFGMPSAISINVLTNQDNVWGFALMLSGLAMAGLILIYGPMKYRRIIVNDFGIDDWKLPIAWVFMISILVPFSGTGLIIWWAYDLIISNPEWYQLTLDSMTTTLLEWFIIFFILITANAVAVWRNIDFFHKEKQSGYDPHNPDYIPKDELQSLDEFFIVSSDSVNMNNVNQMQTNL
ncbi:sodium-dependent transporter [Schistosoma japonicum]|nr:sodium-dependent transporter [Schistosoma japonicum]